MEKPVGKSSGRPSVSRPLPDLKEPPVEPEVRPGGIEDKETGPGHGLPPRSRHPLTRPLPPLILASVSQFQPVYGAFHPLPAPWPVRGDGGCQRAFLGFQASWQAGWRASWLAG